MSRTVGVALVVGLLAFIAGLQFGPPRGAGPTVAPNASGSGASTPLASLPDRSRFATAIDPNALLREAGLGRCQGGGIGGSGSGRAYMITSGRCSIPAAQQPALILKLEGEISTAIRETATSRDGGLARLNDPEGPTIMSWDYRSDGFDGSIYLVATHTGVDLHVVIVLSEQLPA